MTAHIACGEFSSPKILLVFELLHKLRWHAARVAALPVELHPKTTVCAAAHLRSPLAGQVLHAKL
eukprot:8694900-Alexandrium_andersonii.AAC.1